jgi:hypothetical protein
MRCRKSMLILSLAGALGAGTALAQQAAPAAGAAPPDANVATSTPGGATAVGGALADPSGALTKRGTTSPVAPAAGGDDSEREVVKAEKPSLAEDATGAAAGRQPAERQFR